MKYTKGFRWSRKSKERAAKEALLHAWSRAFRGRKKKKKIKLDRKLLSEIAVHEPAVFKKIVDLVKT